MLVDLVEIALFEAEEPEVAGDAVQHPKFGPRGQPLPATIELSAYRIVEHLLTALGDRAGSPVDVAVRFGENALEIRVSGPIGHGSKVKAALARAKERANLLGGSVEVKMAQGRTGAVAQLPVPSLP